MQNFSVSWVHSPTLNAKTIVDSGMCFDDIPQKPFNPFSSRV
jgi:hypothetical protein